MSSPTTIAIALDGTVWFTESNGNRIGRMNPDGSHLTEFDVPTPESAPRIIALGADGNLWFSGCGMPTATATRSVTCASVKCR